MLGHFNDWMLLYIFDDRMFCWLYATMPTCFNYYMPTCFENYMPVPFDDLMITCSNIHML